MPSDSYSQYGMANFQANWKFLKASRTRGSWVVLGMIYCVSFPLGAATQRLSPAWDDLRALESWKSRPNSSNDMSRPISHLIPLILFPKSRCLTKIPRFLDFTDCDEWNREVKFPVLLREGLIGNQGVDSWVKGTNCHAGWVGVYCWYSNKSSITHWFWGFWVRKNPLVRERGKTKHWLQLVLPHLDIFPSILLPFHVCYIHLPLGQFRVNDDKVVCISFNIFISFHCTYNHMCKIDIYVTI